MAAHHHKDHKDDAGVYLAEGAKLTPQELADCTTKLRESPMFSHIDDKHMSGLAQIMRKSKVPKGNFLLIQGQHQEKMFVLQSGTIRRLRESRGKVQHVDISPTIMGSLHLLRSDPSYASLLCTSDVEVFTLSRTALLEYMKQHPEINEQIIYSLSRKLRLTYRTIRTPLLQQETRPSTIASTSIAAATESFYRSALNAMLNARLTNSQEPWTLGRLFPNMYVQLPSRVVYINGFKGLRAYLQEHFPQEEVSVKPYPMAWSFGLAITPGLVMTPVSSLLEACNAHLNTEPLWRRWLRGITFRATREVIFGIGLNQLTDYCEERTPHTWSKFARNFVGSCAAGMCSGYLSHVPHNLSTLKLMHPTRSYWDLFRGFAKARESGLPASWNPTTRAVVGGVMSVVAPMGLHIRTTQICGSFVVINGLIAYLNPGSVRGKQKASDDNQNYE